jgi:hypothetical protein
MEGKPKSKVLEEAVDVYIRSRFFESIDRGYAELKKDKKAWDDELKERELWENTLGDGLEEE